EKTGEDLGRWLRYGAQVGALHRLSTWDAVRLSLEARSSHTFALYTADRDDLIQADSKLFYETKEQILEAGLLDFNLSPPQISPLRVLSNALNYAHYGYAMSVPAPVALAE